MEEKSDFHNYVVYVSDHTQDCIIATHKQEAKKFAKKMAPAYEAMDHPIYDRSEANLSSMLCSLIDEVWKSFQKKNLTPEEMLTRSRSDDDPCMYRSTGGMNYTYKLWNDGSQTFTFTFEHTHFLGREEE